jgi:hypothetical protein
MTNFRAVKNKLCDHEMNDIVREDIHEHPL